MPKMSKSMVGHKSARREFIIPPETANLMNTSSLFLLPAFACLVPAASDTRWQPTDIAPISRELIRDVMAIRPGSTIGELRQKFRQIGEERFLGEGRFAYRANSYIQMDVTYEVPRNKGKPLRYMPLDTDRILSVSHPYLSETWVRMGPPHTLNADLKKQLAELKEIRTVRPGMTRKELEQIFQLPEGLTGVTDSYYQYRKNGCIFIQVFFDLQRDENGRFSYGEDDKIIEVSKPMLSDRERIHGLRIRTE